MTWQYPRERIVGSIHGLFDALLIKLNNQDLVIQITFSLPLRKSRYTDLVASHHVLHEKAFLGLATKHEFT